MILLEIVRDFVWWLVFHFYSNSLAVVVEDSSSSCCVTVKVFPHMTTTALKQQVSLFQTFSLFHHSVIYISLSSVITLTCLLLFILSLLRCFLSTASTRGCSAGWSASACAATSALWPRTAFVRTATRLSCTSCQPDTSTWHTKCCSRTRRAPFSSRLPHCRCPSLPSHIPLPTAPHLRTGGHTLPCPRDSIRAATLVSGGFNMWVWSMCPVHSKWLKQSYAKLKTRPI